MDWQAFWLTIRLSALVAAILVVLGLPVAFWITYSRWRWKFLAEAVFALPIVLPPTVLGFYILVALGTAQSAGTRLAGTYRTHPGVHLRRPGDRLDPVQFSVCGAALRSLVFGGGSPAGGGVADTGRFPDQDILPDYFASVLSGLVTGIALSFAHTMGEFGVVLMVGGNIPGVTRTVSIDIYDKVQAVNYSGANATALVLLAISFVTLAIVYGLNRRVWIWKGVQ